MVERGRLGGTGRARVVVHGTIQAGAMIEVNGARKILDAAVRGAEFIEWGGALEVRSL